MPSYNVKQIAYTSPEQCVQNVPVDVYNMQGSAQAGDDPRIAPYQQIVLQPRPANDATGTQVFSMNKTYYLELTLPKNLNYDMQYAIRLIKLPEGSIMIIAELFFSNRRMKKIIILAIQWLELRRSRRKFHPLQLY